MNKPSIMRTIQLLDRPVFRTREVAALRGTSVGAASQALRTLERQGVLTRATRGIWCVPSDPRFNRFLLVNYLNGGHRAYVSFVSALHLHGIIEQIPHVVYAATNAHSHVEATPLGKYSFHQIDPKLFVGFDWYRGETSFLAGGNRCSGYMHLAAPIAGDGKVYFLSETARRSFPFSKRRASSRSSRATR